MPVLRAGLGLPTILGAAALGAALSDGMTVADVAASLSGPFPDDAAMVAASFDTAILAMLSNQPDLGLALQADVLAQTRLFRVAPGVEAERAIRPLRLLGIAAPGGLQTNMPIEFITAHLPVCLDIAYVTPGIGLPSLLPEHDLAICLVSDARPDLLAELAAQFRGWPRPVLNDPGRMAGGHIELLSREGIARLFDGSPDVLAPPMRTHHRAEIAAALAGDDPLADLLPGSNWPILIRPETSHAGKLLEKLACAEELRIYLASVTADRLTLSTFVDYRDRDGLYRKRRIALIEGEPYLAHLAISSDWMIHYVNAGMLDSATKRQEEAQAMARFEDEFARKHQSALDEIASALGMDYLLLDCAEAPDGRLLLFEVEMAAIIHALDPVDLFPYKSAHMHRIFEAFGEMLERAAGVVAV